MQIVRMTKALSTVHAILDILEMGSLVLVTTTQLALSANISSDRFVKINLSPVYTAQTNPGRTRVRHGLKLTQVVFTRHFSKLTRVEPGLVVFTQQTNPG